MIVLYEYEISPFCEKVRRGLAYKGLAYKKVECGGMSYGELKRINPRRKVPVLEHNGRRIVDSSDILNYLEQLQPKPTLYANTAEDRAQIHLLEDWADESLIWHEVYMRFHVQPTADRLARRIGRNMPAWMRPLAPQIVLPLIRHMGNVQGVGRKSRDVVEAELHRHYEMLDELLKGRKFLVTSHMTAADLAVSAMIWGLIDAGQRDDIDAYPRLAAWYERVSVACGAND